jgi:hypothetical protein
MTDHPSSTRTKRVVDLGRQKPLLDVASYGRAGPAHITRAELEHIERTVRRTPEVLVKVSGGARTLAGVERNLRYIGRSGRLALECDSGVRVGGKCRATIRVRKRVNQDEKISAGQFSRFLTLI